MASLLNESPHDADSVGREKARAILAYFCAVNTATLSSTILVARNISANPYSSVNVFFFLFLFVDGALCWLSILFTAMLPSIAAYAFARRHRIHSVIYYALCGAVMGALFTLFDVYLFPGGDDYDPAPFLESYLSTVPGLIAVGTVGGVTFWYKAGRHLSNTRTATATSSRDILFRRVTLAVAAALCIVVPGYVVLPIGWYFWRQAHCTTETRQKISNLSGFDFETTRMVCDTPAKPAWVRVFAAPIGRQEETLLFEFIPYKNDDLPIISVTDHSHIEIATVAVSAVLVQVHDWGNVHVDYRIAPLVYHYENRGFRDP